MAVRVQLGTQIEEEKVLLFRFFLPLRLSLSPHNIHRITERQEKNETVDKVDRNG